MGQATRRFGHLCAAAIIPAILLTAGCHSDPDVLRDRFSTGDAAERAGAIREMGASGDSQFSSLLLDALLKSHLPGGADRVVILAEAFGRVGSQEDLNAYMREARDERDIFTRGWHCTVLGYTRRPEAIAYLSDLVWSEADPLYVRLCAALGLAETGSHSGLALALATVKTVSEDVPFGPQSLNMALRVLTKIADPDSIPPLQEAVHGSHMRSAEIPEPLMQIEYAQRKTLEERLDHLGGALRNEREDVRLRAVYELIRLRRRRALQLVIDAARDAKHPAHRESFQELSFCFEPRKLRFMLNWGFAAFPGGTTAFPAPPPEAQ